MTFFISFRKTPRSCQRIRNEHPHAQTKISISLLGRTSHSFSLCSGWMCAWMRHSHVSFLLHHSTKSLPLAHKCVRFTIQKKVLLPQILVISVEIAPFLPTCVYHTVSMLTISPSLRCSSEATLHWPSCQIFNQHWASGVTSDLHIPSEMVTSPSLDSLNLHFWYSSLLSPSQSAFLHLASLRFLFLCVFLLL